MGFKLSDAEIEEERNIILSHVKKPLKRGHVRNCFIEGVLSWLN